MVHRRGREVLAVQALEQQIEEVAVHAVDAIEGLPLKSLTDSLKFRIAGNGLIMTLEGTVTEFQWTNPHAFIEIDAPGANGRVTHWVGVINDITEARHYERRLHHLVGRSGVRRRLQDDQHPGVQVAGDRLHRRDDVGHVGVLRLAQGSRHADVDRVELAHAREVRGRTQLALRDERRRGGRGGGAAGSGEAEDDPDVAFLVGGRAEGVFVVVAAHAPLVGHSEEAVGPAIAIGIFQDHDTISLLFHRVFWI